MYKINAKIRQALSTFIIFLLKIIKNKLKTWWWG